MVDDVPVELIDVLYVSKQGTHLLWPYGKVAHVDDVSQIVLKNNKYSSYQYLLTSADPTITQANHPTHSYQ